MLALMIGAQRAMVLAFVPAALAPTTAHATTATEMTAASSGPQTFTTNLPVDKGDIIALDNDSSGIFYAPAPSALTVAWFQAAMGNQPVLPDGSSGSPNQSQSSLELMLNA